MCQRMFFTSSNLLLADSIFRQKQKSESKKVFLISFESFLKEYEKFKNFKNQFLIFD